MVVINKFHKLIICLLLVFFACIITGAITYISFQRIGITNDTRFSLFLGFSFCLLLFLLTVKIFRWVDLLNEKTSLLLSIIILALIACIFIFVSFSARVTQFVDSLDVMDSALYLSKNGNLAEDLPYIKYVESFGNNYPQILLQTFLVKILIHLGFQDIESVLNHLNVIILVVVIVLTWLIVRETRGIKAATKTACICLLNPYLYLIVNWTYSMTYSMPIMMGMLYVALRLKGNNTTLGGTLLALLEGLLIGVGFLIRPTSVFPLIATIIVWLPLYLKRRISKNRIVQFLCMLVSMIIIMTSIIIRTDRRFSNIKPRNLPLTFWLMMGSHDEGVWNDTDFDAVRSIPNSAERTQFALDQMVKNYEKQGVDGIGNLWFKKLNTLWSDGGFFYRAQAVSENNLLSDYYLGNGARKQLTALYCQAFRLFMILGFFLTCIVLLYQKRISEIVLIMMMTVFGSCVFHMIWESDVRYSIPFLLPMIVSTEYGISTALKNVEHNRMLQTASKQKRELSFLFMAFMIVVCIIMNTIMKSETTLNFYRIFSSESTRYSQEIEPWDFRQLDQDFYTSKPFNTVFFKASLPEQIPREECSEYELSILSETGRELCKAKLLPQKINGAGIKATFNMVSGYDHYYIRLEKTEPEKKPLLFYTQYTYGVDPYRGTMRVNKGIEYPSNLLMDVYEEQQAPLYDAKARTVIISLILLSGVFIAFVPVRRNKESIQHRSIL